MLSAQTTSKTPRDSVEVLTDEEIEELFKKEPVVPKKDTTPAVVPTPKPPVVIEEEDYIPEPTYDPSLDVIRDVEDDYVDTVQIDSIIEEEEDYVIEPDTFIKELDIVLEHDTVVEEPPFVEDIQFDAVIPFPYTVNEGDKQVYFSKGNLQYQASTKTWRFARHQYDYIGGNGMGNVLLEDGTICSNNNLGRTYRGWIDLFAFGTSGWNSGAKAYMPYSNELPEMAYQVGKSYTNDLMDDYEKADWGIFNVVDGYTPGTWYTLTGNEWDFLVKKRPNADKLCGFGMVGEVRGLILLPDQWDLENVYFPAKKDDDEVVPDEETPQPQEEDEDNETPLTTAPVLDTIPAAPQEDPLAVAKQRGLFIAGRQTTCRDNIFTIDQWATMEAKGAVFLPANGSRKGIGTAYVNVAGYYQSTSTAENIPANTYSLFFIGTKQTGFVEAKHSSTRSEGYSVRLVKDVK